MDEKGNDIKIWSSCSSGKFPKCRSWDFYIETEELQNRFIEEVIVGMYGYMEIEPHRMDTISTVKPVPLED